jgi:hemoglobin-like flavoprotein
LFFLSFFVARATPRVQLAAAQWVKVTIDHALFNFYSNHSRYTRAWANFADDTPRRGDLEMNDDTVALVRESWKKVEAIAPVAAALFYENLFAADPGLRSMFKGDMQQQGGKLTQMISVAVDKLDDLPTLVPALESLARRHADYGVTAPQYQTVGDALLKTLGQGLAQDFTPAVRDAWTQVYGLIAEVMIAATRRPSTAA